VQRKASKRYLSNEEAMFLWEDFSQKFNDGATTEQLSGFLSQIMSQNLATRLVSVIHPASKKVGIGVWFWLGATLPVHGSGSYLLACDGGCDGVWC
jgi:arabinogalactan endo-1,4-beta-galactosidase